MTTQQLDIKLEEPEDNVYDNKVFPLIRAYVQPGFAGPVNEVVSQLILLVPEGQPYSSEMHNILDRIYEIAEQIPFDHSAMDKLVTLVELCLKSPRFPSIEGSEDLQTDPKLRYKRLSESLHDYWDSTRPESDTAKYINFQAFVARVERDLFHNHTLAIYTLRNAFDEDRGEASHKLCVQAAAYYLLLSSPGIHDEARLDEWSLWYKKLKAIGTIHDRTGWQRWYNKLSAMSAGVGIGYSAETVGLVKQAIVAMEAAQRGKA